MKSPDKIIFGEMCNALSIHVLMLRSSKSETREFGGLYVEHIRKELELCFMSSQMDCTDGNSGRVYVWKTNDLKHKQHHLSVQINLSIKSKIRAFR